MPFSRFILVLLFFAFADPFSVADSLGICFRDLELYDPALALGLTAMLAETEVEDLGLDFSDFGDPPCPVSQLNRGAYVRRKVKHILVVSRYEGLIAVRKGFHAFLDMFKLGSVVL